jgi:hypothetical protein
VFDHQSSPTEDAADAFSLAGEELGPLLVVGNERDLTAVHPNLSDGRRPDLSLSQGFILIHVHGIPYSE